MEIVSESNPFICGVVEGFYNRPWNQGQRVDLYKKLNAFGLNAYLYAPKDDVKHRALWRDLYDESELKDLKILIDGCRENDVTFYYGISPGLDIGYSNPKDMVKLKAKLDQLVEIGCKGFAVLWDDIGTQLPVADRNTFNSLGDAHVKVCNEVYEHLKRPAFLTCPVEYCTSRAEPTVMTSPYLNSLGLGLHPNISIFWTGSKVVPEHIYKDEIIELSKVLRRKPLIWDNLHANDYDTQRVFLGPYSGRSPDLIPLLEGIFTNPNCEYSLNIPALFTIASWSHCYDPRTGAVTAWNPAVAAELSISHFLEECHRPTKEFAWNSTTENTEGAINQTTESHTNGTSGNPPLDKDDIELLFHFYWLPHSNGKKAESLINDFRQLRDNAHIIQKLGLYKPTFNDDDLTVEGNGSHSDETQPSSDKSNDMDMEEVENPTEFKKSSDAASNKGERHLMSTWLQKASQFNDVCKRFERIMDKMTHIKNREMLFDLHGYLNNLNVILQSCNRYLKCSGIERCSKPNSAGLTLAGLPGGLAGDLLRLYPAQSNDDYPVERFRTPSMVNPILVCQPLPEKSWSILGPAFSRLLCESHGVSESEVPENVIKLIQSYRVDAFLAQKDVVPLVVETSSITQPAVTPLILPGIAGAASAETFKTASVPTATQYLTPNISNVPEGKKDDSSSNVIAALVGTHSVGNVIKILQQKFDEAKAMDSSSIPIALPNEGGLPWNSLGTYDILMTFTATPRILFTKLLADAFRKFFEMTMETKQNSSDNDSCNGSRTETPVSYKYGILMEKTSAISIQFLYDQGFRKVENFSNFIVMEIEKSCT